MIMSSNRPGLDERHRLGRDVGCHGHKVARRDHHPVRQGAVPVHAENLQPRADVGALGAAWVAAAAREDRQYRDLLPRRQPGVPWRGDLLDDAAHLVPLDSRVQLDGRAQVAVEQMQFRSGQPTRLMRSAVQERLGAGGRSMPCDCNY